MKIKPYNLMFFWIGFWLDALIQNAIALRPILATVDLVLLIASLFVAAFIRYRME